jgi:serine protease AprX
MISTNRAIAGLILGSLLMAGPAVAQQEERPGGVSPKLNPTLLKRFAGTAEPVKTWVFFADKAVNSPGEYRAAIAAVAENYNRRAICRRQMRGPAARGGELFSHYDLPVPQAYIDAVTQTGARLHITSRWLDAISVYATRAQADAIAALPFVDRLEAVARARRIEPVAVHPEPAEPAAASGERSGRVDYGASAAQLQQINLPALHDAGYTGQNVIIGILDTGFRRDHQAFNQSGHVVDVIAEYDFVDDDPVAAPEPGDPSGQHSHGTMILGCIGAYFPGQLVGGAFDASFILCKTEDTTQEVPAEEDNYVAGLEFIEAHGGDMETSSLGYIDWYTQDQLDGQTAVTTIAVNISTSLGIHHCNAAGNEYHDSDPTTSSLIAPADAFQCITCGAVDSTGAIAYFSSDGPTADGRVKPEVLARGISTHTVDPYGTTGYTTADGTSLSTPLVACAVACLCSARPYWTVDQMRERLFTTADYYVAHGTFDPMYVRGYGIVDAFAANDYCSDAGVVTLDAEKYACEDGVTIEVVDCGLDADPATAETILVAIDSNSETGVEQVLLTETGTDSAQFVGSIDVSTTDAPGVLLVAPGDTVTATYVDEDDGDGHYGVVVTDTAVVDCTPPVISDVHAAEVQPRSATIAFTADEPVRGTVHYGLDCEFLTESASGSGYSTSPTVALSGLQDNTTYYYSVEAADEAGNIAVDPNCYTFTTPEVPDYFTEVFGSGDPNDLDNLSLLFEPNGSNDFYFGCVDNISELPTDPEGGTALSISEDQYVQVTITGGHTVSLYGTEYSSFWVSDNGYITFGAGDSAYTESPEAHFELPRISALFDDFSVDDGGDVSYKQLDDRIVVTYLHVPEYNTTDSNTFQVEMYFDGRITISYLQLDATDGLAGLSQGLGLSPDFFPTDLSAMGACYAVNLSLPYGSPELLSPDEPTTVSVRIRNGREAYVPDSGTVYYSYDGGAYDSAPLTHVTGEMFEALLPPAACGDTPRFYFSATGSGGTTVYLPEAGAEDPLRAGVGTVLVLLEDNFEADHGWTVWNDASLTSGAWERGVPVLPPDIGAPAADFDGSGKCYVTDNRTGNFDVDGGPTILTSPVLDASAGGELVLDYARWFTCDDSLPPAQDFLDVSVSNDGGASWVPVQHNAAAQGWVASSVRLSDHVGLSANMQVRFSTMDEPNNSITEAGIDAVRVYEIYCGAGYALGDLNCDGAVNGYDIDPFVLALTSPDDYAVQYPLCDYMLADTNGDGAVNGYDIDPFVAALTGGGR